MRRLLLQRGVEGRVCRVLLAASYARQTIRYMGNLSWGLGGRLSRLPQPQGLQVLRLREEASYLYSRVAEGDCPKRG